MTVSDVQEIAFLAALAISGRKLKAAKAAGVSPQWYREKAREDEVFKRKMALALVTLHEEVEDATVEAILKGDKYDVATKEGDVVTLSRPCPPQLRLKYLTQFCPGWTGMPDDAFQQAKELIIKGSDGLGFTIRELVQGSMLARGVDFTPDDKGSDDDTEDYVDDTEDDQ